MVIALVTAIPLAGRVGGSPVAAPTIGAPGGTGLFPATGDYQGATEVQQEVRRSPAAIPPTGSRIGGPAAETRVDDAYVRIAIADVLDEPSEYLVDPKPPVGTRLYVVRFSAVASGAGTVLTHYLVDGVHVLDDRGC